MDRAMKTIEEIAREKEAYNRQRALLIVPEKIRLIVEMQKRRAPIMKLHGKTQFIWQIEEDVNQEHS
jgi:hypothetical protein